MASLGSYIRSAARATFSAYRTVPIRWRLAGGSAALTFVILAGFAAIVGVLTTRQVAASSTTRSRTPPISCRSELQPDELQLDRARQLQQDDQPERLHERRARPDPDLRRRPARSCARRTRSNDQGRQDAARRTDLQERPAAHVWHVQRSGYRVASASSASSRAASIDAALRPPAVRPRPHARARARFLLARRPRRHGARAARRSGDRAAGDAPDRAS